MVAAGEEASAAVEAGIAVDSVVVALEEDDASAVAPLAGKTAGFAAAPLMEETEADFAADFEAVPAVDREDSVVELAAAREVGVLIRSHG